MKDQTIYPGELSQVNYWTRRWGITSAELNDAILQTGSISVNELKKYLQQKSVSFSASGILKFIRLHT